jgi:hypothetical protein
MPLITITAAPFRSDADVRGVLAAFHDGTLPRAAWNHRAHLAVALSVARTWPDAKAIDVMRDAIQRFNAAVGIENTPDSGYHETLTRFYMVIVGHHVSRHPAPQSLAHDANRLFSEWGATDLALTYYSRERLFSRAARAAWTTPDLAPLPHE